MYESILKQWLVQYRSEEELFFTKGFAKLIFAKADLLPIGNDSEKKKLQVTLLILTTSCNA